MRARRIILLVSITLSVIIAAAGYILVRVPVQHPVDSALIQRGDLSVLFRSNAKSPQLLSGVQSILNVRQAPDFNAFDPDSPGQSGGLNLEHIFGGHRNEANMFSPRSGRYDLFREPDGSSVTLVRHAEEDPWAVSNTLTFTLREPNYVDMTFRCIAHDAGLFGSRRYAAFFFANYMNDVFVLPLYFRGLAQPGGDETWIAGDGRKQKGQPYFRGGGTYRSLNSAQLECDDDHNSPFNVWSYDWPRFTKPMYYGMMEHEMVFILMFDRMCTDTDTDEIRFAMFRSKRDYRSRPAWDFMYVIRNIEQGRDYGFRARAVWKKFISPADCLHEYETWKSGLLRST